MLNHRCWLCEGYTGHTFNGQPTVVGPDKDARLRDDLLRVSAAFQCGTCYALSIGILFAYEYEFRGEIDKYFESHQQDIVWRPEVGETKKYPDVPEHIAETATEAYECASVKHNRAAILLARAVIEATAKEMRITGGQLYDKIEALASQGFIRDRIKDAAHGVRELGNDMAHGDFIEPVTDEDTNLVIGLMGEILDEVFQSPARIAQLKATAKTRKDNRLQG